jgi:hypothetical protein
MKDPNISKRVNYTGKGYTGCGHLLREIFVSGASAVAGKNSPLRLWRC